VLRADAVAGDADLGRRFLHMADKTRYPSGGVSAEAVLEIRRMKARVDSERLPRGADPKPTPSWARGLADIEWTVQLLQLRYASEIAALHNTSTLESLDVAAEAALITTKTRPCCGSMADRDARPQRAGAGSRQTHRPVAWARAPTQHRRRRCRLGEERGRGEFLDNYLR